MSSYIGKHAELYDLFYSEKDYKQEAGFVRDLIVKFGKKISNTILEIACGTGNHAFELEKLGYGITATDYSESMIDQAKRKAVLTGSSIAFDVCDMRNIDRIKPSFDTALCLFDSIGYVLSNDNIHAVVKGINEKLNDGGLFIVEFWHAAAMLKGYDPVRVKRWKLKDSDLLRISETKIDHPAQTCSVCYSIYELNHDGSYSFIEETQKNRFFLLQEMRGFLESCNFQVLGNFAGFSNSENIDDNTWHIVTVARKITNHQIH